MELQKKVGAQRWFVVCVGEMNEQNLPLLATKTPSFRSKFLNCSAHVKIRIMGPVLGFGVCIAGAIIAL